MAVWAALGVAVWLGAGFLPQQPAGGRLRAGEPVCGTDQHLTRGRLQEASSKLSGLG